MILPEYCKSFGILGSGFGLYGYLPAILHDQDATVVLPQRYRHRLLARSDIAQFEPRIIWANAENEIVSDVRNIVICRRPSDQSNILPNILRLNRNRCFILEKPLAQTPKAARHLSTILDECALRYRIGYNFRYLDWFSTLSQFILIPKDTIDIRWEFVAHHYREDLHNWKRYHSSGGGALRFFAIHLVAVLAELDYHYLETTGTNEPEKGELWHWSGRARSSKKANIRVEVNCRSDRNIFSITSTKGRFSISMIDPFSSLENPGTVDRRNIVTKRIVDDLVQSKRKAPAWYSRVIDLWNQAEDDTTIGRIESASAGSA